MQTSTFSLPAPSADGTNAADGVSPGTARIRHRLGVALTRCVCRQYCTPAFGSVLQRLKSPAQTAPSAIAVPQEVARAKEQPVELRHEINDPVTGIPESQLSRKVYVFSPSALALPPSCSLCCEGADSWCCLPRIAAKSAMQSGGEKMTAGCPR